MESIATMEDFRKLILAIQALDARVAKLERSVIDIDIRVASLEG